jgi:hypothetical protein
MIVEYPQVGPGDPSREKHAEAALSGNAPVLKRKGPEEANSKRGPIRSFSRNLPRGNTGDQDPGDEKRLANIRSMKNE